MTPGFSWTRFQISIISPSVIPCPRNHALFMTSISRTCWMIKGRISSHKTSNTCDLVPSPAPSPVSASQNGCLDFLALASFWAFASASLKRMSEDPNLEITMFKCQWLSSVFIQLFPSSASTKFCQRRSRTRRNVHVIGTLTFSLLPPAILHFRFEVTIISQLSFHEVLSEAVQKQKKCTCNRHTYILPAPTPPSSILGFKFLESVSEVVQRNTRNVDIVHTSTSSIPLLLPHHFRFLSICLPFPFNDASFPPLTAIQPSQSINIRPV